jgi:hypothetical protein
MRRHSRQLAAAFATVLVAFACFDSRPALGGSRDFASRPAASHPRPSVTLDRLDLTKVPLAAADEAFLRKTLADEARLADWGAGRSAHIEYRFRLDELSVTEEPRVVRVRCSASGFLPKGRGAKSHIAFGGAPNERQAVVRHVLEIVARGVVTRLSDLERRRRAQ